MSQTSAPMPSGMSLTNPAFARTLLLPVESTDAFAQFLDSYIDRYRPVGTSEYDSLEEMVWCRWRLRRNWMAESGCASAQLVAAKNKLPAEASPMEVLSLGMAEYAKTPLPRHFRYQENSLTRQARDAERKLVDLQTRRQAQEKENAKEGAREIETAPEPKIENEPPVKPAPLKWTGEPGDKQPPSNQPVTPIQSVPPTKAA